MPEMRLKKEVEKRVAEEAKLVKESYATIKEIADSAKEEATSPEEKDYIRQSAKEFYEGEDIPTADLIDIEDYSDWDVASIKDLDVLRIPTTPQEIIVPIDYKERKIVKLYIREPTIKQKFDLISKFYNPTSKDGKQMDFYEFYKNAWILMVVDSAPRIRWKQAKYYNKIFMGILLKRLPNPLDVAMESSGDMPALDKKK